MSHKSSKFGFLRWNPSRWARVFQPQPPPEITKAPGFPDNPAFLELVNSLPPEPFPPRLQLAQAMAAAGTGPQPFDRSWIGNDRDLWDDIPAMTDGWGYHKLQELIEVLNWALASPQGQRAQALVDDPHSPWSEPLGLIQEMRQVLLEQLHELLEAQAYALDYSEQWMGDLSTALKEAH